MQLTSFSYALFVALSVPLYWALPGRARGTALLLLSLFFYAAASLPHALLVVGLSLAVFAAGQALLNVRSIARRRAVFVVALCVCAGVLGFFKYARFSVQSLADAAGLLGWPVAGLSGLEARLARAVAVPLGISFFTFEFIHYLTDVYQGRITREQGGRTLPARARDFLLFALFFPTLLAGPIKRYQQFVPAPRLRQDAAAEGLSRIVLGLAKKILVADALAGLSARLAVPDQVTPLGLWLGMYGYAGQIYADFSGYSDLAIGTALLLGYRVPENFDWPYLSTSLPEFWRRWHISLSSWIRDYLFIPLGGSRVPRARAVLNLICVMALCGLWHGPAWHFVVWGLWHGAGLGVTQVWRRRFPVPAGPGGASPLRRFFGWLLTLHFVCVGWVLFAAPSLRAAAVALGRMSFLLR